MYCAEQINVVHPGYLKLTKVEDDGPLVLTELGLKLIKTDPKEHSEADGGVLLHKFVDLFSIWFLMRGLSNKWLDLIFKGEEIQVIPGQKSQELSFSIYIASEISLEFLTTWHSKCLALNHGLVIPEKKMSAPYIKPSFGPSSPMIPFSSPTHITSVKRMHRSSCRVITGCLSSTPIPLLHIEALLPPLRVTLTQKFLSFFERALRLPPTFPIASLANSNPRTRLKKSSWKSFSISRNLTPNLHLARKPLILCPPKPPWSTTSTYTISLHLSSPCSRKDPPPFATPQLPPIFPPYLTAISLSGLTVRYLAGWGRVVQGYTSSVQNVSLLPPSPSRLVSGLPVIVRKPSLSYMLLNGVSLITRHVILNLSPFSPTLYLSYQLSLPPYHI